MTEAGWRALTFPPLHNLAETPAVWLLFFFLCSGQETVALFLSRRPLIATSRTCLVQVHDGQELMFGDVKVRKVQLNFFHC